MAKTVISPQKEDGQVLFNVEEKLFEDIKANPGEKAYVFIHTVPYEGSVALVNLLTSTRLVRKGFDVHIILYGPGVLLASGTRGFPAVGQEAFPGPMAIHNQIKTLIKDGANIYACPFAMGALSGLRWDDLLSGAPSSPPARSRPGPGSCGAKTSRSRRSLSRTSPTTSRPPPDRSVRWRPRRSSRWAIGCGPATSTPRATPGSCTTSGAAPAWCSS